MDYSSQKNMVGVSVVRGRTSTSIMRTEASNLLRSGGKLASKFLLEDDHSWWSDKSLEPSDVVITEQKWWQHDGVGNVFLAHTIYRPLILIEQCLQCTVELNINADLVHWTLGWVLSEGQKAHTRTEQFHEDDHLYCVNGPHSRESLRWNGKRVQPSD